MVSDSKQKSITDWVAEYSNTIALYAFVLTIVLLVILLKDWFGIDVLGKIGGLFKSGGRSL